jgi:ketosteroid isomerase-like protein
VFGPIAQDVEGFTVTPDELLDAGDRVVSLGRYRGTGSAGPVDAAFAHVWTVGDGRVTKFVQYADTRRFGDGVGR